MKKIILAVYFIVFVTPSFAATQAELTARVEKYLNSLTTLSADFTQVDPEGNVAGGKFLLKRPGKFKWEYDQRQPVLIVADGKQLVYYDKKLKEVSYTGLENSLAGFIARKNIRLSGDVKLISIEEKNGFIRARLMQKGNADQGNMTMFFDSADTQLSKLEIEDANGNVTKIMFENQKMGEKIADSIFIFRDPKFNKNVWERK